MRLQYSFYRHVEKYRSTLTCVARQSSETSYSHAEIEAAHPEGAAACKFALAMLAVAIDDVIIGGDGSLSGPLYSLLFPFPLSVLDALPTESRSISNNRCW